MQRHRGYFARGARQKHVLGHFIRRHRVSVLAGLDSEGVVASFVVTGSYTAELFNFAFREAFLAHVGNFATGASRSIVICDNCAIHKNQEFINMVRERGGLVHFLPPYSPDYMPVEQVFCFVKDWLRRNRDLAEQRPVAAIYNALEDITFDHALCFFQQCGY